MSRKQNTHRTPPITHTMREKGDIRKDENKWYPQPVTHKIPILPTPSVLWEKFDPPFIRNQENLHHLSVKREDGGVQLCFKVN